MAVKRYDYCCPVCGRLFTVLIRDVIRGRTVRCPSGHNVKLVDEHGRFARFEGELRKVNPKFRF